MERLGDAAATVRVERETQLMAASRTTFAEFLPAVQVLNSMQAFERVTYGSGYLGLVKGPLVREHLNKIRVARARLVVE